MTHPTPNSNYTVANGAASDAPFIEVFLPRNPTPNDVNYKVQQRWWNTAANTEFLLVGFTTTSGFIQANWQQVATGAVTVETFTGDDNLVVDPVLNNINLKGQPAGEAMGAILFTKSVLTAGQMNAQVQTDGTTIGINGANQLHTLITSASKVGVDTSTPPGTNPVLPTAGGQVNFTGAQIAAGSTANVIRTDSTAANTVTVEVQRATTAGASTASLNGVCHFSSAQFAVDGNGFVQLAGGSTGAVETVTGNSGGAVGPTAGNINIVGDGTTITISGNPGTSTLTASLVGGGAAIEKVNVQTGTSPILPSAGAITINGATVAAGTNPVRTDGTGPNTMAIEVQRSQAIAATDATKIGLSAFDSGYFSVDGNGFTAVTGGTGIVGNTGTAFTSSPATQYNVQVGGATSSTLANVAPGTTRKVLMSNGAAANPSFLPQAAVYLDSQQALAGGSIIFNLSSFFIGGNSYPSYILVFDCIFPVTNGDNIIMQISTDGGATYLAAGYQSGVISFPFNSNAPTNYNSGTEFLISGPCHATGIGGGVNGIVYYRNFYQPALAISGNVTYNDTGLGNIHTVTTIGGVLSSAAIATNLKITSSGVGGLLNFGNVALWGLWDSLTFP